MVLGLATFVVPFSVSGWMFGYGSRPLPWLLIALTAICFWTLVLAATRSPFDYSWATQWSIMAAVFLAPAIVGAVVREVFSKRTERG